MSSKAKGNGSTDFEATSVPVAAEEASTWSSTREEEIRHRAYEIYLERGEQAGRDLDDWLQAELEWERPRVSRAQAD